MKKTITCIFFGLLMLSPAVFALGVYLEPHRYTVKTDWGNYNCPSATAEWACVDSPYSTTSSVGAFYPNADEAFEIEDLPLDAVTVEYVKACYKANSFRGANIFAPLFHLQVPVVYDFWLAVYPIRTDSTIRWYCTPELTENPFTLDPWTVEEVNALQVGMTTKIPYSNVGSRIYGMNVWVTYYT
jgi:hypothetical protein